MSSSRRFGASGGEKARTSDARVAAETLYVGDIYEIDVQGARGAGITPVLLDPLTLYGEVDCARIDRLARLLELLPERSSRP